MTSNVRVLLALFVASVALVALSHGDLLGTGLLGAGAYLLWPKGA